MKSPFKEILTLIIAALSFLTASTALAQATGGTVTTSGAYTVHTFYSNGTFTANSALTVDAIIVAGGGGGGIQHAGGGGAGGVRVLSGISANGSYAITVGAGGAGGTTANYHGASGVDSSALGYTAIGGGYGSMVYGGPAGVGGSGGGYGYDNPTLGGAGTGGQGYSGNTGSTGSTLYGGGGGGAGGAGNGITGGAPQSTWAGTFAGGGGGGFAGGGGGGAGAGAGGSGSAAGGNASPNTGSGGGGGGNFNGAGGNGGSGIVVIRYLTAPITRSLTLTMPSTVYAGSSVSIPTSASTSATDGEVVWFYHGQYSTDGGANWTWFAGDGSNLGTSATRTANFTAGGVGSTILVRVRIAFRNGAAGDVDYSGAAINWGGSWDSFGTPPAKTASITVVAAPMGNQTGVAGSLGVGTVTFPGTTTVTASGGQSTGAYEFRQNGGTGAVSFSGSGATRTLTPTTAGTAVIEVRKLGDTNWNDSAWVGAGTLTINKGTQAALTAIATPSSQNFPATVALSSSGGSGGGAVTYAIVSGPGTISGTTLTPTGVGTVTFTATKAGDANYNSITSANTNVTINKGTQAALTAIATPSAQNYPSPVALSSSGGSGSGAVTYAVVSGPGTISGTTLTPTGVGTVAFTATKAADANYNAITSPSTNVTINKGTQTGVGGSLGVGTVTFPGTTTVTASGGQSTGAYEFRQNGGTGTVAFSGSGAIRTITPTVGGTAVIEVRKLGDTNWNDSAWVGAGTLTINPGPQAALTAIATPAAQNYPATVALSSSGGSGSGAVTYAIVSGPGTISGSTLTPTGVGTVALTATKAADASYSAITSANLNVAISQGTQSGVAGSLGVASVTMAQTTTVTASGGQSTGAYEVRQNGGTGAVSFSGSGATRTVTPTTTGTAVIEVRKLGDANYNDSAWVGAGTLTINSAPLATGGTMTQSGGYFIHTFTVADNFVVNSPLVADVIVIGGGGGGGGQHAGGGGAGGMVAPNGVSVSPGSYAVTIGGGGNGSNGAYGTYGGWSGQNGANSSALGYTAFGGGAGGGTNGNNGGSGGGANAWAVQAAAGSGGVGTQGFNGAYNSTDQVAGGGGGGLGGAGNLSTGGAAVINWAGTFGGGGGGGFVGGAGGGAGAGAGGSGAAAGGSAAANSGSGGGGGGNFSAAGGNGGSGIVIIRYQSLPTATVTLGSLNQTYDGSPRVVTATTNPSGLPVSFTYDGSATAPTGAGTYAVVGTVSGGGYQGQASGTLTVTATPSYSTVWQPSLPSGGGTPSSRSPDGVWSYRYDTLPLEALSHPASATWSAAASDPYLAALATQTAPMPAGWWNATTGAWENPLNGSGNVMLLGTDMTMRFSMMESKAPTATSAGGLNADGYNPILAFKAPLAGVNTYSVKAVITKAAGANAQSFGDGVLVEVYQIQHSNSNHVARLWSSLLARADANALAKINLLADLAFGDEIFFRVSSPTTNGDNDLVKLEASVERALFERFPVSPSGGSSDTDAINDAIAAAVSWLAGDAQRDRAIVELEGIYYLGEPTAGHANPFAAYLGFSGLHNITLRGKGTGASLIAKDFKRGLAIVSGSENVNIESLIFDYEQGALPFLQAVVAAPQPGDPAGFVRATLQWQPNVATDFTTSAVFGQGFPGGASDPALAKATTDAFQATAAISGFSLTFQTGSSVVLAQGDSVILRSIPNPPEGVLAFYSSTDCEVTDVTMRAAANLTIWGIDLNGLHVNRYKVERSQTFVSGAWSGPARLISASKDGVHFQGSRRGPSIENSSFDGLGDDGVNVHGEIEPITAVDSSNTGLTVGARNPIHSGDVLVVTQATAGYNSLTHLKVNGEPTDAGGGLVHVNVTAVASGAPSALPSGANYYVNASASAEGFIIRNSRFTHIRPRANLIQTGFGLILENAYDTCSQAGLTFNTDLSRNSPVPDQEGPYPRNIVTRFNYFSNGLGYLGSSPLKIWWTCPSGPDGDITNLKQSSAAVVDDPVYKSVQDQITSNGNLATGQATGVGYLPGSFDLGKNP